MALAPADLYVGVSIWCLLLLCLYECDSKFGSQTADRCRPRPAHHLFSFKRLELNDTEEVKYRNACLSH